MDLSSTSAQPPLVAPTLKPSVYKLLKEAQHDVGYWARTKGGVLENPSTNTYWAMQWSFVDAGGHPPVLCLWWSSFPKPLGMPVVYNGNDRAWRNEQLAKDTGEKNSKIRRQLSKVIPLSENLEELVRQACKTRSPVRVIIVSGNRDDDVTHANEAANEVVAEKVEARYLDPVCWWVHSYDNVTGAYQIYRGMEPPPEAPLVDAVAIDPGDDRLFTEYLATLHDTVRNAVIKARVGQGLFRDRLLERWENSCAVTGLKASDLLIASHIRAWSDCESAEDRLSAANGLLLVPNLDKLFDQHLISFDDDFKLIISPLVSSGVKIAFNLMPGMTLRKKLADMRPFLAWHRERLRQ